MALSFRYMPDVSNLYGNPAKASDHSVGYIRQNIMSHTMVAMEIQTGQALLMLNFYLHSSDDGHLAKLVRTVAFAEQLCRPYEEKSKKTLPVTGDMWPNIGNIAVDSIGVIFQDLWVRGAGFFGIVGEVWSSDIGTSLVHFVGFDH
ncbi:uncharacterized protein BO97DRAFT_425657 [Aspergillus homomorphus CBS 101889]|uniref:Uncharacterized protein n=1 Tax=Aspergillus homomorphus (strain CBS 101889) TaxID=1450537 RepID=A0A395HVA7_ASPHC|nr:hypothetical protein BO97DRAFT_425657 [Aspergillus homomorphus CBS 101889]RAL11343.1 hypothetical protein BO97DRAFT_425657 [Aspergillus homomorphus CBS 101889]